MLSGDIPPNQTVYLRNLNEKVKKEGTHLFPGGDPARGRPLAKIPRKTLALPIWAAARCRLLASL
jgi:hypothetical protein